MRLLANKTLIYSIDFTHLHLSLPTKQTRGNFLLCEVVMGFVVRAGMRSMSVKQPGLKKNYNMARSGFRVTMETVTTPSYIYECACSARLNKYVLV